MRYLIGLVFAVGALMGGEKVYATFDVIPSKSSTLTMDTTGIVAKIRVDVGSVVKEGDVLLELENSIQKNDLLLAQKDLDTAKINLERAQNNFDRYNKVKDVVDELKLDSYRFELQLAQANIQKAQALITAKQLQLAKTYLKSPYGGTISAKKVDVGDGVSGMTLTPLFELITSNGRRLILSIDEKYAKQIKVGQPFIYTVDGESKERKGKIFKIYPAVDSKNRALKAEVKASGIKAGIFGDGYIEVN